MFIICHYSEIGLKGKNRDFFENQLCKNIKNSFEKYLPDIFVKIKRLPGRILIELKDDGGEDKIKTILKNIFGIANFSFAIRTSQDIKEIEEKCLDLVKQSSCKSFRITTQRANKSFPLKSQDINIKIGDHVVRNTGKKVNLTKPDINCFIEIVNKDAFVYTKKIQGPGGIPVGASGKALVLISGGIDSPVASYYALKRGAQISFLHFHSLPYTSQSSINKVKKIVKILEKFGAQGNLYLFPFADIQKQIMIKVPEKLRIILYRRTMMRIAEILAQKKKYLALFTGESLGQVASQTLENIRAIEEPVVIPILRPLIGFDKEEIIAKAQFIKTYKISILPHEDCCVRFMPKHPETKAKLYEVHNAEEELDIDEMIRDALEKTIESAIKF